MGWASVLTVALLSATPDITVSGVDPSGCDVVQLVRVALERRGVTLTHPLQLERRDAGWFVRAGGSLRSLGAVSCEEAASLTAAIVQVGLRPAPVIVVEERDAGEPPSVPLDAGVAATRVISAPVVPPSPKTRPPRDAPEAAPPPIERTPDIPVVRPEPVAPPRVEPVVIELRPEPGPAPDAGVTEPESTPPLLAATSEVPPVGPSVAPLLSLSVGGFFTSAPEAHAAASLTGGAFWGRWSLALSALASWPRSTPVVIRSRSGELVDVTFDGSLAISYCFGARVLFCPGLSGGARALWVQPSGNLYQSREVFSVLPRVGAELSVQWRFADQWALMARLAPWFPLGQSQVDVEGTNISIVTGLVEGFAGLGLVWSPGYTFF